MERVILHVDMNSFYASVECLLHPELRGKPVAVCGDAQLRHGIILAKSEQAKKFGVSTGEPIWQAQQKCPDLVCVQACYKNYVRFSNLSRKIFLRYTGRMEPFGLDEAWLDLSAHNRTLANGTRLANELRATITRELGITASIGVSFNKIFAKLGSDLKKPDATSVISRENFRSVVWPLPVSDLLYVGRSTRKRMMQKNICTIGDLACSEEGYLRRAFGKWGSVLWSYANGYDCAPVADAEYQREIKSIGNSTTTPRDLTTPEEVRSVLTALCENVAQRLKKYHKRGQCVQLSVRFNTLERLSRQCVLPRATDLSVDLLHAAVDLFRASNCLHTPIRSIGVRTTHLSDTRIRQLDVFEDFKKIEAEAAVEQIRSRFGSNAILRGNVWRNQELSEWEEGKRSVFPQSRL